MAKFVELIGRTVGVIIDAETAMADWNPSVSGRLKKVGVVPGGIAATTLIENGYIKLASAQFGGVDMYVPFNGGGIFTAPGRPSGMIQWTECDLKLQAGNPVKLFYYNNVLPVTPELTVFAEIEA